MQFYARAEDPVMGSPTPEGDWDVLAQSCECGAVVDEAKRPAHLASETHRRRMRKHRLQRVEEKLTGLGQSAFFLMHKKR